MQDLLRLFWFRPVERTTPTRPGRAWTVPARVQVGMRVILRVPIASPHTTWVPEGAAGLVVGGNAKSRQVTIELDTPRTVVTVPWAWVEEEPAAEAEPEAAAPPAGG